MRFFEKFVILSFVFEIINVFSIVLMNCIITICIWVANTVLEPITVPWWNMHWSNNSFFVQWRKQTIFHFEKAYLTCSLFNIYKFQLPISKRDLDLFSCFQLFSYIRYLQYITRLSYLPQFRDKKLNSRTNRLLVKVEVNMNEIGNYKNE